LALESATAALILVPDPYSSNTLLAAAAIQLDPNATAKAEALLATYVRGERPVNEEQARRVLEAAMTRLTG
jgi:hypothetical protein